MKVLVTGGAGYIGSHMVDMLIRGGYEVVIYDSLVTGHRSAIHPKATFVQGDLLDQPKVQQLFQDHQFDGIFHFASYIVVPESMVKPFKYLRDNYLAAANLLEAATEHGVKRFILSSTAALFDAPETIPIKETERVIPGSPYGESKAMIERLLYCGRADHPQAALARRQMTGGGQVVTSTGAGHAVINSGSAAPTAKLAADARAAWIGRALIASVMPSSSRACAPNASCFINCSATCVASAGSSPRVT